MNKYTEAVSSGRKFGRQERLLEIVRLGRALTQGQIVKELKRFGFKCTQASVSRDIAEMGLVKQAGQYALSGEPQDLAHTEDFARAVKDFLVDASAVGGNMIVVKTLRGTAQSVAEFLDSVAWPGIAGTIAGDNTIFIAVQNGKESKRIVRALKRIKEGTGGNGN